MPEQVEITEFSLREDLDMAIQYLEAVLRCFGDPIRPEALECLSANFGFGAMWLHFNAGRAEVERLLVALRLLLDAPGEGIRMPTAKALARVTVELDPIIAIPCESLFRSGVMERLREGGRLHSFGDLPLLVAVRGADKAEAEKKIAWLLSQMGVPAESRVATGPVATAGVAA